MPIVPLLSKGFERYYRSEIVILTREERIPLEEGSGFFSEHKLIFYENGVLVKAPRNPREYPALPALRDG